MRRKPNSSREIAELEKTLRPNGEVLPLGAEWRAGCVLGH